jgi:rhodanese-related sulfurtransferase
MSVPVPEIDRVAPDGARLLQAGGAIVVDVRSHPSFVARHVDGARSVPAEAIAGGGHGLPKDRELILY